MISGSVTHLSTMRQYQRDQFYDIHRFLHFEENAHLPVRGEPGYDHVGEIRGILERVQERFQHIYKPHWENSIDEAMIPFQGLSTLKANKERDKCLVSYRYTKWILVGVSVVQG